MGTRMTPYRNLGGDSNVSAYENGADWVRVQFNDGSVYTYTVNSAGSNNINHMKSLAVRGYGLNGYINSYARKLYAHKQCCDLTRCAPGSPSFILGRHT